LIATVVLGSAFVGAPLAQTSTTFAVHNFEVISVDGHRLVVRDERGTNAYTVPDDFRMTVDGKKMSVAELKPGMKGTATVTTTTTSTPVFVTEVKEGVVLDAGPGSITIRNTDGTRKRFTRDQMDQQGLQIVKEGRVIRIDEAQKGDSITATIVSKAEPVMVTEKEVQATTATAQAKPESAPAKPESAPAQMAKADATPPAAEPASAPAMPAAVPPAPAPSEPAGLGMMWWLVIAAIIAVVVYALARRRKQA
jgi:thiol:disulfide interchange protein